MRTKSGIFGVAATAVCICLVWYGTSIQGKDARTRYRVRPEVRPEIRLPEYRTDAARAIDAYERLMDRFIELNQRDLGEICVELKVLGKRLQEVDAKLAGLLQRLAAIEKALGIEPAQAEPSQKSQKAKPPAGQAGGDDSATKGLPGGGADRMESYSL